MRFLILVVPNRVFRIILQAIKPWILRLVKVLNKLKVMKNLMLLCFALLMSAVAVQAQETPLADSREHNQRTRIREGVVSGEVTHAEAKRLRREQRNIHRTERRAKSDGEITPEERARIQQKQNRASRDIRRQKHDRQDRPRDN
jgi:hypothetical protein